MRKPVTVTAQPAYLEDIAAALAEAANGELPWLPGVHLAVRSRQLLAMLMKRDRLHREVMHAAIYSGQPGDPPSLDVVDVHLSKLRTALAAVGIVGAIRNLDSCWWLTSDAKATIGALMKRSENEPPPARVHTIVHPIQKGVPVPKQATTTNIGRGGVRKFQWGLMKTGESFFAENSSAVALRISAREFIKRYKVDKEFAMMDVVEKGKHGARAWRTK